MLRCRLLDTYLSLWPFYKFWFENRPINDRTNRRPDRIKFKNGAEPPLTFTLKGFTL